MKALTVFLCLLLSIVIAFGTWFMITGTLDAQVSRVTAQASEYPEAFDSIRGVLTGGGAQAIYSTGDSLENRTYAHKRRCGAVFAHRPMRRCARQGDAIRKPEAGHARGHGQRAYGENSILRVRGQPFDSGAVLMRFLPLLARHAVHVADSGFV